MRHRRDHLDKHLDRPEKEAQAEQGSTPYRGSDVHRRERLRQTELEMHTEVVHRDRLVEPGRMLIAGAEAVPAVAEGLVDASVSMFRSQEQREHLYRGG